MSLRRVPPSWTGSQPLTLLVTFVNSFTRTTNEKRLELVLEYIQWGNAMSQKQATTMWQSRYINANATGTS